MQRRQAFQYELMPTGEQQRQRRRFAGSCRVVFNEALDWQRKRHARGESGLGDAWLCKALTAWRNGAPLPCRRMAPWLAEAPIHPLQQSLKDLERAYANFFARRADFPRFRKKGQRDRLRYPDPKRITLDQANRRIRLPKLGWLRYRNSRLVLGAVNNVTVSQNSGKWSVSIQAEREVAQPMPQGEAVGIDMGIARFATLSDGSFYVPLNRFQRHEIALRKAPRAMRRKTKFSNHWKQAKARVQSIQTRIDNARRDSLHKTSHPISQNHAMVCIEDLPVRNMSRSAAGTAEQPGRNVRAKSGLNRAILDQGGFEFRRQLDDKLALASWLPCLRRTRAAPVRVAATSRRTTGKCRRNSCASNAVSRETPMPSARSMF